MRTVFASAAIVAAFSVSAAGQIIVSADLYKTPDSPLDSFNLSDAWTLDILVNVPPGDDWTSSVGRAEIVSSEPTARFVQYPNAGNFRRHGEGAFADREYDTCWDTTTPDPGPDPNGVWSYADPTFVSPPILTDRLISGNGTMGEFTYFDTPPNGGAGVFVSARYTIRYPTLAGQRLSLDPLVPLEDVAVVKALTSSSGWPTFVGFDDLTVKLDAVPEPATLTLLLGGLLTTIRRR